MISEPRPQQVVERRGQEVAEKSARHRKARKSLANQALFKLWTVNQGPCTVVGLSFSSWFSEGGKVESLGTWICFPSFAKVWKFEGLVSWSRSEDAKPLALFWCSFSTETLTPMGS
mmetsp:Transcript_49330/g.104937  ORF Transcript_49330/g.104937 Transcript_49330/m.104937 type:complete len:116 (-) Transcript_49330:23-370(-)